MDSAAILPEDHLDPPARIFERLRQLAGYAWDDSKPPFHSTYDIWHYFGTRFVSPYSTAGTTAATSPAPYLAHSPTSLAKLASPSRLSTGDRPPPPVSAPHSEAGSDNSAVTPASVAPTAADTPVLEEQVVARVSYHVLREERAFHIAKSLIASADPNGEHIVKPLDLVRLAPAPGDRGTIVVAIYQFPGPNHLFKVLNMGPAFYWAEKHNDRWVARRNPSPKLDPPISLQHFLDFAIGATQCLEIIHHGQGVVHGEIRGDAFHHTVDSGKVKLVSFGSGLRSFEHGLTSTGWSALSKELGARTKLQYISPEQTGRMPAEPDTRTDIYSLGVLFWSLLTQQPVFEGETPLDIVQGVLGRRIPNVSTIRMDVPDVIGRIIQKCTSKNVGDRYFSASGLRYDLVKVQKHLSDGDMQALKELQIASKDVSSFFMLPTMMTGRDKEKADLLKVIERVAKTHAMSQKGVAASRYSDGSTVSNEVADGAEVSSEGTSSAEGTNRRSGSFTQTISSDPRTRNGVPGSLSTSGETMFSGNSASPSGGLRPPRPWDRHQPLSLEARSLVDSLNAETRYSTSTATAESGSSLSRQLGSAKFRRRGHCEIVLIEGAGGLGKSCLVQSVLADARRRGYCATAKFETARRTAFGPLLKLLSSLFRQVWGERNTETPFHQALEQYVRPVWPMLHKTLGLPEFLLGPPEASLTRSPSASNVEGIRAGIKRRGSSPETSSGPSSVHPSGMSAHSSQDFLRSGSSTRTTVRLMNTFLEVLRMFAQQKFICFCLDDLHFADDESLELITQIIAARLKMVMIITYRPEELSPDKVQQLVSAPDSEEFLRAGSPTITKITLAPLSEEDIVHYVSATLSLPKEEVLSLALVLQSKTAGNPFYMREMLNAGYRKKSIWYDYLDGQWKYDLPRLFDQFQSEQDYDVLDTAYIVRRLKELPAASRSILAWAALLGQSFSFDLICRLMAAEVQYDKESVSSQQQEQRSDTQQSNGEQAEKEEQLEAASVHYSQQEVVVGLEAAIQACIIVPSDRDDRFRFVHDRYIHAAAALKECHATKMHFIIAETLLKQFPSDSKSKNNTAAHISEALDIIKKRIPYRRPYRKLLFDCAQEAAESGARPTAARYYSTAVNLLQPNAWSDGVEDVSYDETIQLHLRAAECYLYMGVHSSANTLLGIILENARTELDKAAAWVLQSRIFAQNGDSNHAFKSLGQCLIALDVDVQENPTFEECDKRFERLSVKIQAMDRAEMLNPPCPDDPSLASLGAVLAETTSAGWWSDCVSFYQLTLLMVETHLARGAYPQSGMAFLYLAVIALARFNMIQFAADLSNMCMELLEKFRDPFSMARGYMISAAFIGHVQHPIGVTVNQLEGAVEFAAAAGDRISTILSFGLTALLRFYASENVTDLEAFCQYGCEEIPNWHLDARGGTNLIAIRQVCRALQGKTRASEPLEVMSDEQHNATSYKTWLDASTNNGGRSLMFYETVEIVPVFLYGHYQRAIEIGKTCYENSCVLWSSRNTRLAMLFYGLALAGVILRQQQDPRPQPDDYKAQVDETLQKLEELNKKIKDWQVVNPVNYLAWSKLLDAQVAEVLGDHGLAIQQYEEALDHASEHGFVFEEALGNYLMANIFIRNKARRSARSALRDAVRLYRQFGATGIADRIESEHSIILHGTTRNPHLADAGVQTDFAGDAAPVQYRAVDGTEVVEAVQNLTPAAVAAMKGERMAAWRGSMQPEAGAGLPALDMIDLHAILVSSQVISSVLRVDELLKTMCDVILQTCSGSATLAAIVVQDEGSADWCVAASGDPEKGAEAHIPGIPLSGTHLVAENVILYCTRFREVVFLPDLVGDERFGNVSELWLQKNPSSKAVIAIPICHGDKPLLGVLYLEGVSGSFTDRNVTVLQLLVNQIGISYSNALAMKAVEKVSAENVSMVELQKRALAKAIEAETKAKHAEAEAIRNVKLAEEAAKAKNIFLANVSHELRTPLNGVIGNSELLRDSNLNREQLEMADSIRVSADLLLTVINDILDFSRMEADKMKLYVIAFNPEEMVREVVRAASYSNREKTSKKNVKIIQDIDLPPMLIYGDPIRLHQVLGNLIGNSLKFTEDGSITIGAKVDSETQDTATLTFWVQDTGIGISEQQLEKLFQPFSQADASTARKYGGSGLGLSICKSLIETMMKGTIKLESEENVGTTAKFTVTFEKARPEVVAGDVQNAGVPALPEPPPSRPSSSSTANSAVERDQPPPNPYVDLMQIPKAQLRICIAEDNAINAKIAMQYMHRLGYPNVDTYHNGLKAVEGLREKAKQGVPYHIILMDVQMPVLDGYEATKLLRNDPIEAVRKILVIAMTASAIQGDREKCLAAGMNDYLAKPVRSEVLKKKLDAYVGGQVAVTSGPFLAASISFPAVPNELNGTTATASESQLSTRDIQLSPVAAASAGRTSSDGRSIMTVDTAASTASGETTPTPSTVNAKRQPRKLTKNRNNSGDETASPSITAEKSPKGLGFPQKKNSSSSTIRGVENLPPESESTTKPDDAHNI
ncbi:hsp90-like protein [Diplogelasinospora grovesii]|uniref:histidine kinase n=1 Tax=Diplogelasinospora grovesii TaxID=303347 RepID=A0AAN6S818_9PEZI|nr:hsp90-like protein [Diplogelasinospora grovesii]